MSCTRRGSGGNRWGKGRSNDGGKSFDNNSPPLVPPQHTQCDPCANAWLIRSALDKCHGAVTPSKCRCSPHTARTGPRVRAVLPNGAQMGAMGFSAKPDRSRPHERGPWRLRPPPLGRGSKKFPRNCVWVDSKGLRVLNQNFAAPGCSRSDSAFSTAHHPLLHSTTLQSSHPFPSLPNHAPRFRTPSHPSLTVADSKGPWNPIGCLQIEMVNGEHYLIPLCPSKMLRMKRGIQNETGNSNVPRKPGNFLTPPAHATGVGVRN